MAWVVGPDRPRVAAAIERDRPEGSLGLQAVLADQQRPTAVCPGSRHSGRADQERCGHANRFRRGRAVQLELSKLPAGAA